MANNGFGSLAHNFHVPRTNSQIATNTAANSQEHLFTGLGNNPNEQLMFDNSLNYQSGLTQPLANNTHINTGDNFSTNTDEFYSSSQFDTPENFSPTMLSKTNTSNFSFMEPPVRTGSPVGEKDVTRLQRLLNTLKIKENPNEDDIDLVDDQKTKCENPRAHSPFNEKSINELDKLAANNTTGSQLTNLEKTIRKMRRLLTGGHEQQQLAYTPAGFTSQSSLAATPADLSASHNSLVRTSIEQAAPTIGQEGKSVEQIVAEQLNARGIGVKKRKLPPGPRSVSPTSSCEELPDGNPTKEYRKNLKGAFRKARQDKKLKVTESNLHNAKNWIRKDYPNIDEIPNPKLIQWADGDYTRAKRRRKAQEKDQAILAGNSIGNH